MDNNAVNELLDQAKKAGNFRRVQVPAKQLQELCESYLFHELPTQLQEAEQIRRVHPAGCVLLGVEVGPWEDKQVNRYASVETMG